LYRYGRGPSPDYPENQTACRPNAPGSQRHIGGTICGENFLGGTAGPARLLACPILTALITFKLLIFAVWVADLADAPGNSRVGSLNYRP
jgi:hypothetical protein